VERNRIGGSAGFTLIELMITVAVIAILTGIAYPSYQDHMRKGRRAAAQSFIVDAATRQQQYLLDARGYALGAGALTALNLNVPAEVTSSYTIAVTPAVATVPPTFTITATPIAGSKQVPDGALTLDQDGSKTRAGQPGWQ
jgi:type IV pilus assembly protein PilE